MKRTNYLNEEDHNVGLSSQITLPSNLAQVDEAVIKCLKKMVARRGSKCCQDLIRKWIKERLEIEMRKLPS